MLAVCVLGVQTVSADTQSTHWSHNRHMDTILSCCLVDRVSLRLAAGNDNKMVDRTLLRVGYA